MSPKETAYIVEHLSVRFMAMVADHSRQLAEHRAAFGARTEADAKIIAGLREEVKQLQWENMTMHKDAEDAPATHNTEAGKATAESVIRDSRSAEIEMCVGDEVEVICQSVPMPTGMFANFIAPVGTRGTATMIHRTAGFVELDNGTRASIKDVRKVTT